MSNFHCGNLHSCTYRQSILWKIFKTVATSCHLLRLECTKFDFDWGPTPDPAGGAYSAPPDLPAGFERPTFKGKGMKGREEEGRGGDKNRYKGEGEGKERKERENKGKESAGKRVKG